MRTKYGVLRAISVFYKVLAFIVFVFSLVAAVVSISLIRDPLLWGSWLTAVTWAVLGALSAVSIYANGEFFSLLIDMEENTRASRIVLIRLAKWMASDPARGAGGIRRPAPPSPPAVADEFMPDFDEF